MWLSAQQWCELSAWAMLLALCLGTLPAGAAPQGLQKGAAFRFTVDAGTEVRPVNRRVMGISFGGMWEDGWKSLNPQAAQAIRDLHLPLSRMYFLDPGTGTDGRRRVPWDLKGAIDRVADVCERFGIRQEDFIIELERQAHSRSTSPERWAEAVSYAQSKGYGFRYWEVCNEPYGVGGPGDDPWTPEEYVGHVKAVYQAVKAVDPQAQVGMAADLSPWNHFEATQTDNPMLGQLAGYYDFVSPHFYCHMQDIDLVPFERITFEGNQWVIDAYVRRMRLLLDRYNPGKQIPILDTEWGMHGYLHNGEGMGWRAAGDANRNCNIAGTLHRAIRMIYYLNEGLLQGASQWVMLERAADRGWAIVAQDDDRLFILYYLNYYLGRYVGDEVLSVSGTCPYYEKAGVKFDYQPERYDISMPKAPVLATKSRDGKRLYLVIANGTAAEALPCRVDLEGFRAGAAEGKLLTQRDIEASALVDKESDVVAPLPVELGKDGATLIFEAAAHSVSFIELTAK